MGISFFGEILAYCLPNFWLHNNSIEYLILIIINYIYKRGEGRRVKYWFYLYMFSIVNLFIEVSPLKIDRVILSTNDNPNYIQFWPVAAKAWQEIVGVRPTLALIASKEVQVDTRYGDVIRFEPIAGVSTAFYAQCVRLLLPALFPTEGCLLADIDMMPLQRKFFIDNIKKISDDAFVIYRDKAYWFWKPRVYMCYNAAKGKVFQEIFGATSYQDIPDIIARWHQLGLGWSTDERLLYTYLKSWKKRKTNLAKLGYSKNTNCRIERRLIYDSEKILKNRYIEMNCPRPYTVHKGKIDAIIRLAVLASKKR